MFPRVAADAQAREPLQQASGGRSEQCDQCPKRVRDVRPSGAAPHEG